MRNFILMTSLVTLTFFVTTDINAAEIISESQISEVTVYNNRATVTRDARVELPQGSHEIVIEGLPAILMPDSLRASGTAGADVKFGALTHKRVISRGLSSAREAELNGQLESLKDQKTLLSGEKQALQQRAAFIRSLTKQAVERETENIANMNLNVDQWRAAAEAIQNDLMEVSKAEAAIDVKIRDIDEQIAKVQRELGQLNTGQRSTFAVTIPVEASRATTLNLALDYQVPQASWSPIYDARLDTEVEALELVQYGAVRQNTGEDWEGVKLTLSTAQPQRGASLPDLNPMWVDIWDQNAAKNMRSSRVMALSDVAEEMAYAGSADVAMSAPMPEPEAREASFAAAEIETGGFVSEYKIPGPANVLSDGSETKLMVGAFETESALEIHIKPQISTDAYLVADTKLKGEAPILGGQVSLFRDGAFVGRSSVPLLRPEESHAFYFGIDDQMSVTRKVVQDERKDAGIVLRENRMTKHFVTDIQNLHKQDVKVVVEETIPVAQNEKITVDIIDDKTTQGYQENFEDTSGLLRWEFDMTPQEEKKIELGWDVEWPKDSNISGL